MRIGAEAPRAVQQVLGRVVRGVANERLGIDDEPRLPLCLEDVSGVEVSGQQHVLAGPRLRQVLEEAKALADQA